MSLPQARQGLAIPMSLFLAGMGLYFMRLAPEPTLVGQHFERLAGTGDYLWPESDLVLRRHYTGIGAIDTGLSFLVAAFFPGVYGAGMNRAFEEQQPYFLMSFAPVIAAMSVEAARERNSGAIMTFTSIWALFYQTVGGAIILPLWFLAFFVTSYKQGYYQKSPFVSPISAKALFFAFWIGYVLPTVAIYLPFWTLETKQALVALWQPAPLYLNIIWVVLARLLPHSPKSSSSQVPIYWIKMLHFSAVATSAAFHQILIWHVFSSGADEGLTFAKVLLPLRRSDPTMSQGLLFIFQVDFCLIMLSALLFCYIVVWDANELGMTNIEIISGFRMVLICAVMFGPCAALSMTCIWREDRMRTAALGKSKKAE